MPRTVFPVLFVAWCSSAAGLRAGDNPRAVVERAIKALGGAEVVQQRVAVRMKMKGKGYIEAAGPGMAMPLEGEVLTDPGGRTRLNLRFDLNGMKHEAALVFAGNKSWRSIDGNVNDLPPDEVRDLEASAYRDRVTNLADLLTDKAFALTALPDADVAGRPAAVVKVSSKGQGDVTLSFDKESGLLVKYAYRSKDKGQDKEVLYETTLSDYRDPVPGAAEERLLKEARVRFAGPALLEYLRSQTPDPARLEKARTLIRKLGDETFAVRQKATTDLVALGPVALPLLRAAARDRDPEVSRRAAQCLQEIGEEANKTVVAAAVRLAAVRRPEGAARVLLDLLPGAGEALAAEIPAALFALAQTGKPDEALVRALEDGNPARRAAAAAALGKDGGAYRKEVRRVYARLPRQAMKSTTDVDGIRQLELEAQEFEFFTRFADKEFAKP
jgi:hypothetical protein